MTAGTGYALAAMVCYGLGDFIFKRSAANGVKPLRFLTAQAWVFCPLSFLYAAATGTIVLGIGALWGGLAGLFLLIGFNAFLRSLATGPVSINAPIFRLSFLITAALAVIVLGEPVTTAKFAGLALALVAIWLLLGGSGQGALSRQSLVQVAIATVALGFGNFSHKMGLHFGATPETGVAAQAAVFCSLTTLVTLVGDRGYRLPAQRGNIPSQRRWCWSAPSCFYCTRSLSAPPASWCQSHKWVSLSPPVSVSSCSANL